MESLQNLCPICKKIFSNHPNLRKHALKFHPEKPDLVPLKNDLKTYKYPCDKCKKRFNHKRALYTHKRKAHGIHEIKLKVTSAKCALCNVECKKTEFETHLVSSHNIPLIRETLIFSSYQEFSKWKENIEADTQTQYVRYQTVNKTTAGERITFSCHRTGFYTPKGNRQRRIKKQGSKKINTFCPASIKLFIEKDGKCNVKYLGTHIGHENELSHLCLTPGQRNNLAAKIAANIPLDVILSGIRASSYEGKLQRIHLIKRKDLLNIATSAFNDRAILQAKITADDNELQDESSLSSHEFKNTIEKEPQPQVFLNECLKEDEDYCSKKRERVLNLVVELLEIAKTTTSEKQLDIIERNCITLKPILERTESSPPINNTFKLSLNFKSKT